MIWHVARHELLEHVRSARFLALCALAVILLPLSAHVNASQYGVRLAQAAELRAAQQRKAAERITQSGAYESLYGWRDGEVIADPALRAVRTPSRFAVLALGADAALPAYWQFSTEGVEAGPTGTGESGAGSGAEQMDAMFIVQSVLGLLALLLVFDAVSGERESGVLRLLLAAPVRRADLLLGKALGAVLTLTVPLVLGVAAALAVLEIEGVSLLRGGSLARVAIFLGTSTLYLLHMVALGLAVSATTSRAKSSWVALLFVWISIVLVIPRAAQMVAATTHPASPAFESRQAKITAIVQLQRERARVLSAAWRRVMGTDSVPEGRVESAERAAYTRAIAGEERQMTARKRAAIRQVETARQRSLVRQQRLARTIGWLSPASSYGAIAANLAGTGEDAAQRWLDQVTAHQARLEDVTFDRQYGMEFYPEHLDYLRIIWWPDLSDPADRPPAYRDLPSFAFRDAPLLVVFARSIADLAVLTLGTVAWIVVAVRAFQRAEVQ